MDPIRLKRVSVIFLLLILVSCQNYDSQHYIDKENEVIKEKIINGKWIITREFSGGIA